MADLIDRNALFLKQKAHADLFADSTLHDDIVRRDEATATLAEIINAPAINRCISVEDAFPDTNGEYLVYTDHYEIVEYDTELQQFGHTDEYKDELGYNIVEWYEVHNVTHWMPIPEPPKKEVIS